jgi:hypothetical protein
MTLLRDLLYESKESKNMVDGYKFVQWAEEDDDNRKVFHEVTTPEGKSYGLDWTPYQWLNMKDMNRIVRFHQRIGRMPNRKDNAGKSLDSKAMEHLDVQQDPEKTAAGMKKHFDQDVKYGPYGKNQ